MSESPGVYRMLDKDAKILYIGKAKSLRNRVRSYFQGTPEEPKTKALVARVHDFDVILTQSEAEALILESILIKKHKPRYNVLLKDDKTYPFVVVDEGHTFPKLVYTRKPKKGKKTRIFGPFASAHALREALRFLSHSFQLRDCSDTEFQNRSRACLNYQIGTCSGPCVGHITPQDYARDVSHAVEILAGHGTQSLNTLKAEMERLSQEQEYEKAARLRDQIELLQTAFKEKSSAVSKQVPDSTARDVLGWHRKEGTVAIAVLFVRGGNLVDSASFHFDHVEDRSDGEVLASFLAQFYLVDDRISAEDGSGPVIFPGAEAKRMPDEILLPFEPPELSLFTEGLAQLGHKTVLKLPQKGVKHELIQIAQKNAENAFDQKQREKGNIFRVLSDLKVRLHLENYPRRVECFDISNLGDTGIVASRVTFIEGQADKNLYRRYKIRSTKGQDDFAAMREVIERRLVRVQDSDEKNEDRPDLIIVDGGKGQLSMAVQVMKELNITGIDLVALAKAKTESDFDNRELQKSFERVFKPGRMNPIALAPDSAICHFMQRVRDEAHRFAVEFQRSQRALK